MTEEQPKPEIVKTKDEPLSIGEIGLDALIKGNSCVQKLHQSQADLTNELNEAKVGLDALQKQVDALKPYKDAADERERKEVEALRSEVIGTKVFPDEDVKAMGRDQLEPIMKALKSVEKISNVKTPTPGNDNKHTKPKSGFTVGVPDGRDENGNLKWKV